MNTRTAIPRILPITKSAEDRCITGLIHGRMHPSLVQRCEALFITNGWDERERLRCGVRIWQEKASRFPRYLFISRSPWSRFLKGAKSPEDLSPALYPEVISTSFERTKGVFLSNTLLENTKEEALWLADLITEHHIQSVAFITSPEHIERVFRTFVRQFAGQKIRIPIIAVNTHFLMPPGRAVADGEDPTRTGWDYYPGEDRRLREYETDPPDIAQFEEMKGYLDWLDNQPIMRGVACV